MIIYRIQKLKKKEILNYLLAIDHFLTPKLTDRVDLINYSNKLSKKAIFFVPGTSTV